MKKLKINYNFLVCPRINLPGKPNPKQINRIIKNRLFNKKDIVFVGDTYIDYKTAKNAKIDFLTIGKKINDYNYICLKN